MSDQQYASTLNVLTDPWIPVVYADGGIRDVGIIKCFQDSEIIKTISNKKPYEKIAILRFLTAFITDVYQLDRRIERQKLYDAGSFDIERIKNYVKECQEKNGASFVLGDSRKSFFCFNYNPQVDTEGVRLSAAYLHLELPHGNNPIHIVAQREEDFEGDTLPQFLRAVLAFNLFPTGNMLKGANSKTGDNCYIDGVGKDGKPKYTAAYGSMGINAGSSMAAAEPVFFWPEADNLFHTLVMCMRSRSELHNNLQLNDPPAFWNSDAEPNPKAGKRGDIVNSVSYVSGLAFQARRVVPIIYNGKVKECYISNGYTNPNESMWHDPFAVRLRNHKSGEIFQMPAKGDREMWRNIGNLTASREESWHLMPDVLRPIKKSAYATDYYENISSLAMIPMTQNAGYSAMFYDDTVQIPAEYMEDEYLGEYVTTRMEIVEELSNMWDKLKISALLGNKDKSTGHYRDDALQEYWVKVHQFLFDGDNCFLNKVIKAYHKDASTFKEESDEILFKYLTKSVNEICDKVEKNTNSWNMLVKIIRQIHGKNGCLHAFYGTMRKYWKKEEKAKK